VSAKKKQQETKEELFAAAREVLVEADQMMSAVRGSYTDRFRVALEKLRNLVPEPPPAKPPPPKRGAPQSTEDWDALVLAWALELQMPVTMDRALAALAPETSIGSDEHNAIAASLSRLPKDRFEISWYLASTTLAPKWTKR
jgi:hypothetical protein